MSTHFAVLSSPGLTKTCGAIFNAALTTLEPENVSIALNNSLNFLTSVTAAKCPPLTGVKAPFKGTVMSLSRRSVTIPYLNIWAHVFRILWDDSIAPLLSIF